MNKKLKVFNCVFWAILLLVFLLNKGSALYECKDIELYNTILSFPDSALVAGHPEQMNCVPFFAGKKVLVNQVISIPEAKKLWRSKKNSTYAAFAAIYSEDYGDIAKFCKACNVCHVVIDKYYFSEGYLSKKQLHCVPIFNDFIREQASNKSFESVVQSVPEDRLISINEGPVIVDCS